jgi:HlyD family secretion protein
LKTKKLFWVIGLFITAAGAIGVYIYVRPNVEARKMEYTFTKLKRGDIEYVISSTGTLEAINTIQVGTQISGTISKIYADYNDRVRAGELLAEIDIRLLEASLMNAQANLSVQSARLYQAEEEFNRNTALFARKVISEKEFRDSQHTYEQSLSSKRAAEAGVKSAEVNLGYASIKSPIAGTITERSVEAGQTVAASFTTPTLFIIAEDLSKMQILANVDESDIGYIQVGMRVRFSVQTYPEKKFHGTVSQIRLQPVNINNVVNYKVVVNVANEEGLLLPGMTANLDFISESAEDVVLINNSALRFRPNKLMAKLVKPILVQKATSLPDSLRESFLAAVANEESITNGGFRKVLPPKINGVFYLTKANKADFEFVKVGVTTGLQSEITSFLSSAGVPDDSKIINGIKSKEK